MRSVLVVLTMVIAGHSQLVFAQAVRPMPYSSQFKTDPAVGNIQGVQRYGRQLRTDPDMGEGFSYHVYPVSQNATLTHLESNQAAGTNQTGAKAPQQPRKQASEQNDVKQSFSLKSIDGIHDQFDELARTGAVSQDAVDALKDLIANGASPHELRSKVLEFGDAGHINKSARAPLLEAIDQATDSGSGTGALGSGTGGFGGGSGTGINSIGSQPNINITQSSPVVGPSPSFDWTGGIRNSISAPVPDPSSPLSGATQSGDDSVFQAKSFLRKTGKTNVPGVVDIYHQPLIQIKLRVIEVARQDGLAVNSVLNYISRGTSSPSLTTGSPLNTANSGHQNASGLSNFPIGGLFTGAANSGPGALVNLTSEHINWAASFLATELNADVVTAPEMVTLNGQNVEFVAGEKLPFALGQNVIQGTNNNIQQVFYKHVGTMVSVTPRIVNWGLHGEGRGQATVQAPQVADWNELMTWMSSPDVQIIGSKEGDYTISTYTGEDALLAPYELKAVVLAKLNQYSLTDLVQAGLDIGWIGGEECCSCRWSPEDCTIDLALVVRISQGGSVDDPIATNTTGASINSESNVRALANVIQIKSGHGVVMAGLIGERETDTINKVPILGDIPFLGAAFRSKAVDRVKTEVLIFVEACVLDRDPTVAHAQSKEDFWLSDAYVTGGVHDNPLECGLSEVGIGTYLPPHTHAEELFWERYSRRVQRMRTHLDDILH